VISIRFDGLSYLHERSAISFRQLRKWQRMRFNIV